MAKKGKTEANEEEQARMALEAAKIKQAGEEGEEAKQEMQAPQITPEMKKEFERITSHLKSLKQKLVKKFPFILAIGLLPPQASKVIEEEEEVEKENPEEKLMHVIILVPDKNEKDAGKIKIEAINGVRGIKPRVWIHIKTLNELWKDCLERRFDLVNAIANSFPLHDKAIMGILRAASIHCSMLLKKFSHYIVSYVFVGSFIRGEATPASDVDVYVLIDDTDVREHKRYEIRDKLFRLINEYAAQAVYMAGVKNTLHCQAFILTDFWERVRDAEPVIFTMIRDGAPLYDVRTFIPWKLLLNMGKIIGTPEAMEKMIKFGDEIEERIHEDLNKTIDYLHASVMVPAQGVLMFYGCEPPTAQETIKYMEEIFVDKEKLLERKYVDFLKKVRGLYKKLEHNEMKGLTGKDVDDLLKESCDYRDRLRKLGEQIEKKVGQDIVSKINEEAILLVEKIVGKSSGPEMIKKFAKIIEQGKLPSNALRLFNKAISQKNALTKGKLSRTELYEARKDGQQLLRLLTEYAQRKDILEAEKIRFPARIADKEAELYIFDKDVYVILDMKEKEIKKIMLDQNKIVNSSKDELDHALKKEPKQGKLNNEILLKIEKLLGKKVEILI